MSVFVEFDKVPETLDASVPEANPEIPVIALGADQLYVVFDGTTSELLPSSGATVNAVPEQLVTV